MSSRLSSRGGGVLESRDATAGNYEDGADTYFEYTLYQWL